jgi:hypothetical protein
MGEIVQACSVWFATIKMQSDKCNEMRGLQVSDVFGFGG